MWDEAISHPLPSHTVSLVLFPSVLRCEVIYIVETINVCIEYMLHALNLHSALSQLHLREAGQSRESDCGDSIIKVIATELAYERNVFT